MSKYLTTKTSEELIKNCYDVYNQKKQGKIPVLNGVVFDSARSLGMCQKNVRQIIEATIWGKEWVWPQAACCASNTCSKIKQAGFESIPKNKMEIGDIIYMLGGKKCKTCGKEVGHVGIYVKNDEGQKMIWQNTSYQNLGLCIIPLRNEQYNRINGVFRLFPEKKQDVLKIIDIDTNKVLALVDGRYNFVADRIQEQGKIYLKRE